METKRQKDLKSKEVCKDSKRWSHIRWEMARFLTTVNQWVKKKSERERGRIRKMMIKTGKKHRAVETLIVARIKGSEKKEKKRESV
jgi:hypothetical protein